MSRTPGITLLLGGVRSGKSALAVEIGRRWSQHDGDDDRTVTVIATAEPFDDDMRDRIQRHRADRPDWPTVEEPVDLAGALDRVPNHALAIVDCLTVWVGTLMHREVDDDGVHDAARRAIAAAGARPGPTVVISNEVGWGVHPETDLGRRYRDLLGHVNQAWAAAADRTLVLVAGRALATVDPWTVLGER